jgi:hypothetical protein
MINGTPQTGAGASNVEDTAWASGWNGDTSNAPSQNALHDILVKIDANYDGVLDGDLSSCTNAQGSTGAFNYETWNGSTAAPTQNAIADWWNDSLVPTFANVAGPESISSPWKFLDSVLLGFGTGTDYTIGTDGGVNLALSSDNASDTYLYLSNEGGGEFIVLADNHKFTDVNGSPVTARDLAYNQRHMEEGTSVWSFSVSDDVTDSTWTYTITDTSGNTAFKFVIGGKTLEYTAAGTMSVDATAYAGTDANPVNVYGYIIDNNGTPVFTASNTDPDGVPINHVHIFTTKAGSVSASSVNKYGGTASAMQSDNVIQNTYHRFFDDGIVKTSGMGVTATTSNVTIAAGTAKVIFDSYTIDEKSVNANGQFFIKSDGSYATDTTFTYADEYSDGTAIGANKYFNVVLGVIPFKSSSRIMAVVQRGDLGEYSVLANAQADTKEEVSLYPSDAFLAKIFIPICRIVVQNTGTGVIQAWPNGEYYVPVGDQTISGGGGGVSFSTSAQLSALISDETGNGSGTGLSVFNYNPTLEGYTLSADAVISGYGFTSTNNAYFKLGDNSGGYAFTIKDSDNSVIFNVNSDGEMSVPSIDEDLQIARVVDMTANGIDDDSYTGGVLLKGKTSGESLTQWDLVYQSKIDGAYYKADGSVGSNKWPAIGIVTSTVGTGSSITVLKEGFVRNDGWAWSGAGSNLYMSITSGQILESGPTTSGDCWQLIGITQSDDEAYIEINNVYGIVD